MALYEYSCPSCKTTFDRRMPMSEVRQEVPCPSCGQAARKTLGNFAVVGRADAALDGDFDSGFDGDWDDGADGAGDGDFDAGMEGIDF